MLRLTSTTGSGGSVAEQRHLRVKANIVVGVFAHLTLIKADYLRIFVNTEAHEGDEVHDPQDCRLMHPTRFNQPLMHANTTDSSSYRHNERVRYTRNRISQLPGELDVVLIEPTSGDCSKAVKGCD